MTLSPEERAMRVTDAILDLVMVDGENVSASVLHPAQDIIAKAIREACKEKLEEAKRRIRMTAIMSDDGHANRDFLNGIAFAAERLDALKDPTP